MATCSWKFHLLAFFASLLYTTSFMRVEAASSESAVTWQAYWNEKLPRAPPPANVAGLSSRMSAEEVVFYTGSIRQGSVHTSPSLCQPKGMLCGQSAANGPNVCVKPYFYNYGTAHCQVTTQEGLFFRQENLSTGKTLLYPALANDLHGRTFLPAQLAAVMPFRRDKLANYMALLEIPRGSNMAANMDDTLAFCNSNPADGEVRSCHSSIESMLDFATAHLGSSVAAMSMSESPSKSEEVHVVRQVTLSSAAHSPSITCHDLMFPYLVYGCHVMPSANVYDVELQRASGSTFHGIAVCHVDTRSWNPTHPAFASLNGHPGDGTICHWLPQDNFLYVKA